MTITLVRHGRSAYRSPGVVAGDGYQACVAGYDRAGIRDDSHPPASLVKLAARSGFLISSDTPRALESARRLAPDLDAQSDETFREAALPHAFPSALRLPTGAWAVASRVGWFCGWSPDVESFRAARARARRGAEKLTDCSDRHGSVILVAHQFINWLLVAELVRRGYESDDSWVQTRNWWKCTLRR